MKRCHEAESTNKAATRKSNDKASKKRKRQTKSTDAAATQKATNKIYMSALRKRRRQCQLQDDEMQNAIEHAMKEAKQILQRTQNPTNPHSHKAIVCIICDRFIIGTEKIHKLSSYQISQHSNRLSVKTYETYYGVELKDELRKQYKVNDNLLRNLLLSTQSRMYHNGYATYACCYKGMCQSLTIQKNTTQICHSKWFCYWISSNGN